MDFPKLLCKTLLGLTLIYGFGLPALSQPAADSIRLERILDSCWRQIQTGGQNAFQYANRAQELAKNLNIPYQEAVALEMKAIIYDIRGLKDQSVEHYIQAADIHESRNDREALLATYNNLGVLFGKMEHHDKELHYYQLAYTNAVELKDSTSQKLALINMGSVYSRLGKLDSAQFYFEKALKIKDVSENRRYQGGIYQNLGILFNRKGMPERAVEEFTRARQDFDSLNYSEGLVYVHNGLAESYLMQHRFKKASRFAQKAAKGAKVGQMGKAFLSAYEKLVDAHRGMGHTEKALLYQDTVLSITDSLDALYQDQLIYETEAKYQNEKKQRIIAQLEKEQLEALYQKRLWVGLAIGLAAIGALMVWILILRHRKKIKERDQQQALQKERLERQRQQLAQYRGQLQEVTQNLIRKNKQLAALQMEPEQDMDPEQEINLKNPILTNEDWLQYKKNYELAYPGYFRKLQQKQPDLSEAEQRISALMRLGLSNEEMASMLGISKGGVRKSIYRLRKKMQLQKVEELKKELLEI